MDVNGIAVNELDLEKLPSNKEIVNCKNKLPTISGVYFLIKDKNITYVGQSVNVIRRIKEHQGIKDFDSVSYFQCSGGLMDLIESLYINWSDSELINDRSKSPLSKDAWWSVVEKNMSEDQLKLFELSLSSLKS